MKNNIYLPIVSVVIPVLILTFLSKWLLYTLIFHYQNPYSDNLLSLVFVCLFQTLGIPLNTFEDLKLIDDTDLEKIFVRVGTIILYTLSVFYWGKELGVFESVYLPSIIMIAIFIVPKSLSKSYWWLRCLIAVPAAFFGGVFTLIHAFLKKFEEK